MAKPSASLELEPIDRLEEKLKRLVSVIERLKSDQARLSDDNHRLKAELDALRNRVASDETLTSEVSALRGERDVIRARVSEMLEQLEALDV